MCRRMRRECVKNNNKIDKISEFGRAHSNNIVYEYHLDTNKTIRNSVLVCQSIVDLIKAIRRKKAHLISQFSQ